MTHAGGDKTRIAHTTGIFHWKAKAIVLFPAFFEVGDRKPNFCFANTWQYAKPCMKLVV